MIATDEDSLVCDLAETYHIYDYKSLPLSKVAIFSIGLRDDSRIKMKMNGVKYSLKTILTASILDRVSLLVWAKTEDCSRNINKPKSILQQLLGMDDEKEVVSFNTPEDFENEWRRLLERGE